jgi:hypothetical protein
VLDLRLAVDQPNDLGAMVPEPANVGIGGSSLVIGIATMVDVHDDNLVFAFVNAVPDALLATTRPPQSPERSLKRRTDTPGCLAQRSLDELPGGEGSDRRQLLTRCPTRAWR